MHAQAQVFRFGARRSGAGKGILPFVRCRRLFRAAAPLPSGNRKKRACHWRRRTKRQQLETLFFRRRPLDGNLQELDKS